MTDQVKAKFDNLKTTEIQQIIIDLSDKFDDNSTIVFEWGLEYLENKMSEQDFLNFAMKLGA